MCPIDLDDSSLDAIDTAANIARQNDGSLILVHIVPMIVQPTVMAVHFDLYKEQAETAKKHLSEIARTRLSGIKCELSVHNGEPAQTILRIERKLAPDVLVMSTHGRKGFSHFFLGSVAELVLRGATCPVLIIRAVQRDKNTVAEWMTTRPVTASPEERLGSIRAKMLDDDLCCVPIIEGGRLVGIVSDRDLQRHLTKEDQIEVGQVMPRDVDETLISVRPSTSLKETARLLRELKLQALPVVAEEKLVGVITASDVVRAFAESG
jgi:nucleotide-binding universal stress UspA family protein/CBS domain-containing protein